MAQRDKVSGRERDTHNAWLNHTCIIFVMMSWHSSFKRTGPSGGQLSNEWSTMCNGVSVLVYSKCINAVKFIKRLIPYHHSFNLDAFDIKARAPLKLVHELYTNFYFQSMECNDRLHSTRYEYELYNDYCMGIYDTTRMCNTVAGQGNSKFYSIFCHCRAPKTFDTKCMESFIMYSVHKRTTHNNTWNVMHFRTEITYLMEMPRDGQNGSVIQLAQFHNETNKIHGKSIFSLFVHLVFIEKCFGSNSKIQILKNT